MSRFVRIMGLSLLLGVSLTAITGLVFRRGIDYERRGLPLCWIETQGFGFFGLDRYVIHERHLILDFFAWTSISAVLLTAYVFRTRNN